MPNLIAFFGNRNGRSDEDAIKNCVAGLNREKKAAEDSGVAVCRRAGSPPLAPR